MSEPPRTPRPHPGPSPEDAGLLAMYMPQLDRLRRAYPIPVGGPVFAGDWAAFGGIFSSWNRNLHVWDFPLGD